MSGKYGLGRNMQPENCYKSQEVPNGFVLKYFPFLAG